MFTCIFFYVIKHQNKEKKTSNTRERDKNEYTT